MMQNVTIVSLSSGMLGEDTVRHELEIGVRRLEAYGLRVSFAPHALRGTRYVRDHPAERAQDLLGALRDPACDLILCAIGGDDTYRLLPYLFDHGELAAAASGKAFLGFSDTTIDHLMLHKVGLATFYGQAFLPDVCELSREMLPYTRACLEELLRTGTVSELRPSDVWYESRRSFGPDQVGVPPVAHPDGGLRLLQGSPTFSGRILGGCLDSLLDLFEGGSHPDMPALCARYDILPDANDWRDKILLLETSEEKMAPHVFARALDHLKDAGVLGAVSGILLGKPADEAFQAPYERTLVEVVDDPALPIVSNLNVGHALPRAIVPFGVEATVNATEQVIRFHG